MNCAGLLRELGRTGGLGRLNLPEDPELTIYGTGIENYSKESSGPLRVKINGLSGRSTNGVYERGVMTNCMPGSGIWTKAIQAEIDHTIYNDESCFSPDVLQEECQPYCLETYIEPKSTVMEGAFEGLFETDYVLKQRLVEFDSCEEPETVVEEIPEGEPILFGNVIGRVFEFSGSMPMYESKVFDKEVYEPCEIESRVMVVNSSVYEDGLYEDGAFKVESHLYVPNDCYSDCYDDCVLAEWKYVGHFNGERFIYPQPTYYPNFFLQEIAPGLTLNMWLTWEIPTATSNIYEEGVFATTVIFGTAPYQPGTFHPQLEQIYDHPDIPWEYISSLHYNPASYEPVLIPYGKYLYRPRTRSEILSRQCPQCLPELTSTNKGEFLSRPIGTSREFFIEGMLSEDSVFVADVGYLHPFCREPVIVDHWVPLSESGEVISNKPLPKDTYKIVIVYKINSHSISTVLHYIGNLGLIQNERDTLLYGEEEVDLKILSQTLCHLILSNSWPEEKCRYVYNERWLAPELRELLHINLDILENLWLDAIPQTLPVLGERDVVYDDSRYLNPVRDSYDGVYDNGCQTDIWNDELFITDAINPSYCGIENCIAPYSLLSLSSRNIDNESIAWLLYAFCLYQEVTNNNRYSEITNTIAEYLYQECREGYIYKGYLVDKVWQQKILTDDINVDTQYTTLMSLLKYYDISQDAKYLSRAVDLDLYLHSSIYDGTSYNSNNIYTSVGWSLVRNRVEAIERSLEEIGTTISHPLRRDIVELYGTNIDLENSLEEEYSIVDNLGYPLEMSLIERYTIDALSISSLDSAKEDLYDIPYANTLDLYRNPKENGLALSACLLGTPIFSHETFITNSIPDLETELFNRHYLPQQLALLLPISYGWFDENALKNGNLYFMIRAIAKEMSPYDSIRERGIKGTFLSEGDGVYLNTWGEDLSSSRYLNEPDSEYRNRLLNKVTNKPSSKKEIEKLFDSYNLRAEVSNVEILSTVDKDTYIKPLHNNKVDAPLIGPLNRAGVFDLRVWGHITSEMYGELIRLIAAGTIPRIEEIHDFTCPAIDTEVFFDYEIRPDPFIDYCCTNGNQIAMKIQLRSSTPLYINLEGIYKEPKPGSKLLRANQDLHYITLTKNGFQDYLEQVGGYESAIANLRETLLYWSSFF